MVNLDKFFSKKGNYINAVFQTAKKPSAQFKGTILEKRTEGTFRAGLGFANKASVKQAIENGERPEVGSLPYGKWEKYPYTILHTPKKQTEQIRYVRLYPSENPAHKIKVLYLVNGTEVTKEKFASYLAPSVAEELMSPKKLECFDVKHQNIIMLGEPFE